MDDWKNRLPTHAGRLVAVLLLMLPPKGHWSLVTQDWKVSFVNSQTLTDRKGKAILPSRDIPAGEKDRKQVHRSGQLLSQTSGQAGTSAPLPVLSEETTPPGSSSPLPSVSAPTS